MGCAQYLGRTPQGGAVAPWTLTLLNEFSSIWVFFKVFALVPTSLCRLTWKFLCIFLRSFAMRWCHLFYSSSDSFRMAALRKWLLQPNFGQSAEFQITVALQELHGIEWDFTWWCNSSSTVTLLITTLTFLHKVKGQKLHFSNITMFWSTVAVHYKEIIQWNFSWW